MLKFDPAKLDDLLLSLPPPPQLRTRRPTRESIPTSTHLIAKTFLFIGDANEDEKALYDIVDDQAMEIKTQTSYLVAHSARNVGTLLKVNMSVRDVKCVRVPIILDGGNKKLPKKTKLCCWWCRHPFKSQPIGCPFRVTKQKDIHTVGIFCSCECGLAYANDSNSHRIKLFAGSMFVYMRKKLLKTTFDTPLFPAPHWSSLKAYGGHLTITQFRTNTTKITAIPSFLPLYPSGYNLFITKRGADKQRMRGNVFQEKRRKDEKNRKRARRDAALTTKQVNYRKYSSLKLKMIKVNATKKRKTKQLFKKPKKRTLVI